MENEKERWGLGVEKKRGRQILWFVSTWVDGCT